MSDTGETGDKSERMLRDLERRQPEIERVRRLMQQPNSVFVFGSNLEGRHGKGAALVASRIYGAVWGNGEGLAGRSYALPTKATPRTALTLPEVAFHVRRFIAFAKTMSGMTFVVTRVGCGYANFEERQIAPLFADAPANCELPIGWREMASGGEK